VGEQQDRDPFAPVQASPRFATPLAIIAIVLAVAAASTGTEAIAGPLGMALGVIAHVKGSRLGMPAAILAAIGMVIGLSITMLLR
jgi:hypothetical protein